MELKIKSIKKIPPDNSLILVGKKNNDFSKYNLSAHEFQYLKKLIDKDEKQISINQYNRWIFVQIIEQDKPDYQINENARKEANKLHSVINKHKIENICLIDVGNNPETVLAFAEGMALSNYQFLKYFKDTKEKKYSLKTINIYSQALSREKIEHLQILTEAVYYSRDLVNEPVSYLTAQQLAKEIQKLGSEAGFKVEVLNKKKIESLKMGGLLAVNKGSIDPPTFSILEWKPVQPINKKPIILVGKGVVYDTGGLSLKPTHDSMDYMKSDMGGAASVIGAFYAIARAKLPVHIIGLIPATDNRPDGNAYTPGDVITMHNGITVEVLNTDAEGRMILADALSYARQYKPELVIDIATLTGAAQMAIGNCGSVAMGTANEKSFNRLKESGLSVYERIVEFPFWSEYDEMLKSDIADLKNIGNKEAGAITAGKFLEHFTDYPWIHIDIAGPAFLNKADSYRGKGGTGIGVRLLFEFLKLFI